MSSKGDRCGQRSFRGSYRGQTQEGRKDVYTHATPSTSKESPANSPSKDVYKEPFPGPSKDTFKSTIKETYKGDSQFIPKDSHIPAPSVSSKDTYNAGLPSINTDMYSSRPSKDMKVNVQYRGIVYRVRGVKVLCSVITAVILLLVAIVGLGVWMLVSAYGGDHYTPPANATWPSQQLEGRRASGGATMDFNAPSATLDQISMAASVPNTRPQDTRLTEATGHQGADAGPRVNASSRPTAPAPAFGIFNGLFDISLEESEEAEPAMSNNGDQLLPAPDDSYADYSDPNPVAMVPTAQFDYGTPSSGYTNGGNLRVESNLRVENFGTEAADGPVEFTPPARLPDNFPRDVDPTMMGEGLPFPFPPAPPQPAVNRRLNLRYPGSSRRIPQGSIPGQRFRTGNRPRRPYSPSSIRRPQGPPGASHTRDDWRPLPHYEFDSDDYYTDDYDTTYPDHDQAYPHDDHQYSHDDQPYLHDDQTYTHGQPFQHDDHPQSPENHAYPSEDRSGAPLITPSSGPRVDTHPTTPIDIALLQRFGADSGMTLPKGLTVPPGFTVPENIGNIAEMRKNLTNRPIYLQEMMHYYSTYGKSTGRPSTTKTTTTTTTTAATTDRNNFSHRHGVGADDADDDWYAGPPVVGYGSHPYRATNTSGQGVFQHFWDVYDNKGVTPGQHDDRGPAPSDFVAPGYPEHHDGPRPVVRGVTSDGQGYPIPTRPDAQAPPVLGAAAPPTPRRPIQNRRLGSHRDIVPARGPQRNVPTHRNPPPQNPHANMNPNRRLRVDPEQRPNVQTIGRPRPPPPTTTAAPSVLGPLQGIYDYSQRLVSSLFSFPESLYTRYNESRVDHMRKEVALLADYNKVFQDPNTSSADVLPDMFDDRPDRSERVMVIDTDKIQSLNPLELSLITWTFLDFWEFLIEKVGTLSKDDLRLLEARLERVRQDKDQRMASTIVKATMQQAERNTSLSASALQRVRDIAQQLRATIQGRDANTTAEGRALEARMWDPLGLFNSEQRVEFIEFAMKVVFRFGRVYLTKRYALDCMMLLFCKDLNADSRKDGTDGIAAKVKSVGLKVLTEKDTRSMDTLGEIWRALTAWQSLQCDMLFPKCDGPKALEIVNEVAVGAGK